MPAVSSPTLSLRRHRCSESEAILPVYDLIETVILILTLIWPEGRTGGLATGKSGEAVLVAAAAGVDEGTTAAFPGLVCEGRKLLTAIAPDLREEASVVAPFVFQQRRGLCNLQKTTPNATAEQADCY